MEPRQDRGAEIRAAINAGDGKTAEELLLQSIFGDGAETATETTDSTNES